ncbi:MAG: hypothetical protein RI958_576 [Actinomycetota bacterium]
MKLNRSAVAVLVLASLALSACGDDGAAEEEVEVASPAITVGGASDSLSQLLSSIWAQSLTNAGYRVARKDPLPDRGAVFAALESDSLQLAPELSSSFLAFVSAGGDEVDARNLDTQIEALASALPESLTTADPAKADAGTVLACTAGAVSANELSSFDDAFAALADLSIGAAPGTNLDRIGEVYEADLAGVVTVDAADVESGVQSGTLDCVFLSGLSPAIVVAGLLPLVDERGVIAVDAPIPIVSKISATADVTALLAQVNASLTTEVLRALLVKLEDPVNTPNLVAKGYLETFTQQSQG